MTLCDASEVDHALVRCALSESQLRLRMGELLDALFITRGHHELGFSSIDAYVEERAGENARWGQESRAVARRLRERGLRYLRGALSSGLVSWSMAELLSRHADEGSEVELIRGSLGRTVRSMQIELGAVGAREARHAASDAQQDSERRARHRWVTRGELAMLHTSRMLVSYLSGAQASDESLMTALLGEAESGLASMRERLESRPGNDPHSVEERVQAARHALEGLATATEIHPNHGVASDTTQSMPVCGPDRASVALSPREAGVVPRSPHTLDRAISGLAVERASRDLEFAELARAFLGRRLWRGLGFESAEHYADARPGFCLSSLEHKATLARHLVRHPALGEALRSGRLGTQSALLLGRALGRAAEPELTQAWIERAQSTTYGYLREEVNLVLMGLSFDPSASRWPPGAEEIEAARAIERKVQSGELFRSMLGAHSLGPQTSVCLGSIEEVGSSLGGRAPPVRLHLPDELFHHWGAIESEFHALLGSEAPFVAFLCTNLWLTWLPYLEAWEDKWADVYRRDLHRCQNPVCRRRDVSPHHVVFQAHGGGDEPENVVSLCSWCHLRGVHEERIRVSGRVSQLRWTIGRQPVLEVRGRKLIRPMPRTLAPELGRSASA